MATIFKLLRIQYALSHQDEVDRQDIFLLGARGNPASQQVVNEPGTTATGKDDPLDPLAQNSLE